MENRTDSEFVPALGFHVLTPIYDGVVRVTTREYTFKSALVAQANIRPGHRVLDLACGTGTLAVYLKQSCPDAEIVAVDADDKVLSIARRKTLAAGVTIQLDRGESHKLPYPDSHFDRVTSSLFFHHLSWTEKQEAARELLRVIRPGGELHVADWGRASGPFMRAAFIGVQLLDGIENTEDNVRGRLPELFKESGFTGVLQTQSYATCFGTLALYRADYAQPLHACDRHSVPR